MIVWYLDEGTHRGYIGDRHVCTIAPSQDVNGYEYALEMDGKLIFSSLDVETAKIAAETVTEESRK